MSLTANIGDSGTFTVNLGKAVSWGNDVMTNGDFEDWTLSNVLTNGTFDTDSDWTKGSGWTISDGKGVAVAATGVLSQDVLSVGVSYTITFTISEYVSGTVRINAGGDDSTYKSANGTFEETLTPSVDGVFRIDGGTAFTGKIDNVISTPV